jgi:hypothetical protein
MTERKATTTGDSLREGLKEKQTIHSPGIFVRNPIGKSN